MVDPLIRRTPAGRIRPAGALLAPAILACAAAASARAPVTQDASSVPSSAGASTPQVSASQPYTDDQLKQLLGPIALYPDTLLANTLTAALYPDQISQAALLCASGAPSQSQIDATSWEHPVKAIASVPSVVSLLNQHPDWTQAIGAAYLKQPADVMRIVQQLRATAVANGTLKSDGQQTVSTTATDSGSTTTIAPTNPQVIYAPVYSPDVVYAAPAAYAAGYPAGYWGYADGAYVGPGFGAINCDWVGGYCAWGNAVYNPAWNHVALADADTLHNQWNQNHLTNAAAAAAARPGGIGGPRGVGAVGNPYRPAAAATAAGAPGWPRMPDAGAIPGYGRVGAGGVGRVGGPAGVGTVGGPGGAGSPGRPGGVGSVGGPAGVGTVGGPGGAGGYGGYDRYGGEQGAFYGDRSSGAASQRGAYSNQRSGYRGGYGGGGRR
jgi:hypothetical protein